jgi:hypothetical protein
MLRIHGIINDHAATGVRRGNHGPAEIAKRQLISIENDIISGHDRTENNVSAIKARIRAGKDEVTLDKQLQAVT